MQQENQIQKKKKHPDWNVSQKQLSQQPNKEQNKQKQFNNVSVQSFQQTPMKNLQLKKKISYSLPLSEMGRKYHVDMSNELGHGYASVVYLGFNIETKEPLCVKIIDLLSFTNQKQLNMVMQQIKYLKLFQCQNIVKIYDVYESPSFCYLFMQLCPGRDLYKYLMYRQEPMFQLEVKTFVKGICLGLQEIKKKSMIHRDLKTQNILLGKNGSIKIADLGFCTSAQNSDKMNVGSPIYMSPEVSSSQKYSYASDIYGLGVIWYELYHKHAPWEANSQQQLFKKKREQKAVIKRQDICEKEQQMILKCLELQPEKRCTLQQILQYFDSITSV